MIRTRVYGSFTFNMNTCDFTSINQTSVYGSVTFNMNTCDFTSINQTSDDPYTLVWLILVKSHVYMLNVNDPYTLVWLILVKSHVFIHEHM
jgi:hypothetical protein